MKIKPEQQHPLLEQIEFALSSGDLPFISCGFPESGVIDLSDYWRQYFLQKSLKRDGDRSVQEYLLSKRITACPVVVRRVLVVWGSEFFITTMPILTSESNAEFCRSVSLSDDSDQQFEVKLISLSGDSVAPDVYRFLLFDEKELLHCDKIVASSVSELYNLRLSQRSFLSFDVLGDGSLESCFSQTGISDEFLCILLYNLELARRSNLFLYQLQKQGPFTELGLLDPLSFLSWCLGFPVWFISEKIRKLGRKKDIDEDERSDKTNR